MQRLHISGLVYRFISSSVYGSERKFSALHEYKFGVFLNGIMFYFCG